VHSCNLSKNVMLCSAHSMFRVSSAIDSGRSHTLQANDELDKRHWLQCIDDALSREVLPVAAGAKVHRHSSDVSSTDALSADFQSPTSSHEDCPASSTATYEDVESHGNGSADRRPRCTRSLQVSSCIFEEL